MECWEALQLRDDLVEQCQCFHDQSIVSLGQHIFVSDVADVCAEIGDDEDYWYYRAFCWVYDCIAGKWTSERPMPTVRCMGALVAFEGRAFYIGGVTRADPNDAYYETRSNAVEAWGPPAKTPRWKVFDGTTYEQHSVHVSIRNTKTLYAIGGHSRYSHYSVDRSRVERFKLEDSNGEWVTCAPVPMIDLFYERGVAAAPAAKIAPQQNA